MDKNDHGAGAGAPKRRVVVPWLLSIIGCAVRWAFTGLGIVVAAVLLTRNVDGWRFWAVAALCLATYGLGVVIEYAGDFTLKKERK